MTAGALPESLGSPTKKGGIDYSKFDAIQDSDDETTQTSSPPVQKQAAPTVPQCHNCHKDIVKPLRCSICKKVSYCSVGCQKDDWQYHKRACQKPVEKKAAGEKPPPRKPSERSEARDRKKPEDTVVEAEENLTWYRHREWRPTDEPKREFTPTKIDDAAAASSPEGQSPERKQQAGSVWNAAGTWEEKDVTSMAKSTLSQKLSGLKELEVAGGVLSLEPHPTIEGDASKPVIRGKLRHIFDLSFKLKFGLKWMDSSGQRKAEGTIAIADFTQDTFTESVLSPPAVELSFKEGKLLEQSRRQALEAILGTASWPPPASTAMAEVSQKMCEWAREFEQTS